MSKGQTSLLSGNGGGSSSFKPLPVTSSTRSAATVTGTAWTKLIGTPKSGRHGVLVWNSSPTLQLVGKIVGVGASAPGDSALTDGDFALAPRQSVLLELSDGFDLYGINDSGASTVLTAVCTEVARS